MKVQPIRSGTNRPIKNKTCFTKIKIQERLSLTNLSSGRIQIKFNNERPNWKVSIDTYVSPEILSFR